MSSERQSNDIWAASEYSLQESTRLKFAANLVIGIFVLLALYEISRYNYLLFHILAEFFSIAVAYALFIVVWNSRAFISDKSIVFLGIAYLFIGSIDLIHTITYKGMGIIDDTWGANPATQLWIASRFMESISLCLFAIFFKKRFRVYETFFTYLIITTILLLSVFYWKNFPDCFVEGVGLTSFKKISEYIICGILLFTLVEISKKRHHFEPKFFKLICFSIILTIIGELAFTFYVSVYGLSNLVGHYSKILSFFLIYSALIRSGLKEPYSILFRDLDHERQRLKISMDQHKEAQRVAKIGHWELDTPSGTPTWSDEIFNIFGLDPKESEPSFAAHIDIIHADDWKLLEQSIHDLSETGKPFDLEFRIRKASGEIGWMRAIGSAEKDEKGNVIRMFGTAQDVTDLKTTEESLRHSEEKYRTMMESFTDPLYICTPELKIDYMNPAMHERIGRDATGESCYVAMHELSSKCSWCVFDKVAEGKATEITIESPLDNRHYRVTNMPIKNSNGTFSKMTIFRDITDYVEAVSEKEKAQALFLQSQKLESIGNLAGGIAHDFNNILSSIIGFTEIALDDVQKGTAIEDSLQEVYSAGKRAKNLVKQILTFSRHDQKEIKPVNVPTLVSQVVKMLRSTIPTSIEIIENINAESSVVEIDPTQLEQVIINLATNAKQAMSDGSGTLEVSVDSVDLDDAAKITYPDITPGNYTQITVSDTGIGIPQEHINSIFEPYFTTKEKGSGTGLGLAVVHGIVKSAKGQITVYSEPNKGTTFHVYLPLVTKAASEESKSVFKPLPKGTERVLFIDDEPSIVKMQQQRLESLGYQVEIKTDSIDALEEFQKTPEIFDIIITDMTMPKMTGDELAKQIKAIRPDIPVILCTGFSEKINGPNFDLNIDTILMKPVGKSKMAETVRKMLDEAKG